MSRYPHEFSGGQRQRIGIARALAGDPSLIICDEPVSALDVSIQAQIINLLMDLKEGLAGLTYIFIAHDLSVVKHISDRIAVMYLGRILEITTPAELYANPIHPVHAGPCCRRSACPTRTSRLPASRIILEGEVPSPANPPAGCTFHTRCPDATTGVPHDGARAQRGGRRSRGRLPRGGVRRQVDVSVTRETEVADLGTQRGNIVTTYLADTSVFKGSAITPLDLHRRDLRPGIVLRGVRHGSTSPPRALRRSTATTISTRSSCSSAPIPSGRTTCAGGGIVDGRREVHAHRELHDLRPQGGEALPLVLSGGSTGPSSTCPRGLRRATAGMASSSSPQAEQAQEESGHVAIDFVGDRPA